MADIPRNSVTIFFSTGTIFLQSIPSSRSLHEDSPSISEGWGGKVSDYRIAVSSAILTVDHKLRDPVLVLCIYSMCPVLQTFVNQDC